MEDNPASLKKLSGFTLIELSIVLVIIGLIVGGVLTGRDLIRASEVRATVTQIEKYNTATNTFRDKYGGLPGDLNATSAVQFGFATRGSLPGQGDGDGIINGYYNSVPNGACGTCEATGETVTFWNDLGTVHLVDGRFSGNETTTNPPGALPLSWYPAAKIGSGNFVYVWSNGAVNYFGISAVTQVGGSVLTSSAGLTVQQAYGIDQKIDDGLPQSGRTTAQYVNYSVWGANVGYGWAGIVASGDVPFTTATPGSSTTCFDNGNVAGANQQYSIEISNGANVTCGLSFRFQ